MVEPGSFVGQAPWRESIYSHGLRPAGAVADILELANDHAGVAHVNDQTVNDDGTNPFGGPADLAAFTTWQWLTVQDTPRRPTPSDT